MNVSFGRRVGALGMACVVGLVAATGVAGQGGVRELQIAPALVELQPGLTRTVVVTAYDAAGNTIPGVEFSWTADDAVVRVRRDATTPSFLILEGVAEGQTAVRVRVGSVSAMVAVTVSGGAVGPAGSGPASVVRIEPSPVYVFPTEEVQLQAVFLRDDGQLAARVPVGWRSLGEPVVTVSPQGTVIGLRRGDGVIQVQSPDGRLTDRVIVHVRQDELAFAAPMMSLSPLQSDTVRTVVPAQEGRPVSNRQLRFASTNRQVVNVSPLGVVTATQVGQAEVVVQGFGQQRRIPVVVHRPVEYMSVRPHQGDIVVPRKGSVSFEVTFTAADDSPVEEARALWTVADTSVAVFDAAAGRLTGRDVGTTTLTARGPAPGLEATWTVEVVAGVLVLDRSAMGLRPGDSLQIQAEFQDREGHSLGPADGVVWESDAPDVASVSEAGMVNAVRVGSTRILARTIWGDSVLVPVFVQGPVLVATTRSGASDIYALDPRDPGTLYQVTDTPAAERAPAFSPDGTKIAFISTEDGNSELYVMKADGSERVRLTNTTGNEDGPAWTPDGLHIVYAVRSTARSQISSNVWIINADGTNPQPLTVGDVIRDQPAVSPDGTLVAYRSGEGSGRNIFVMNLDGTDSHPITRDESGAGSPRWFADGRLGFVVPRRGNGRGLRRRVMRVDLASGQMEALTPEDLSVSEFDPLGEDGMVLLVEQRDRSNRLLQILTLFRFDGSGPDALVEVPRSSDDEVYLTPSAR